MDDEARNSTSWHELELGISPVQAEKGRGVKS